MFPAVKWWQHLLTHSKAAERTTLTWEKQFFKKRQRKRGRGKKQFSTNKSCKAQQRGRSCPHPLGRKETRVVEEPPEQSMWRQRVCVAHVPRLQPLSGLHADLSWGRWLRHERCLRAAVRLLTPPGSRAAPAALGPAACSPAHTDTPAHSRDSQHKRESTKHRVRRREKTSWCHTSLSSNRLKNFQMRGSGRACESLSKHILPASPSLPLSRPHTHPFLRLQMLSNLWCPSVRARKKHLLHIVQLQSHQHGPARRMTRADMLRDCSFPAYPTTPIGPMMRKSLHTLCSNLHSVCTWTQPGKTQHHTTLLTMYSPWPK